MDRFTLYGERYIYDSMFDEMLTREKTVEMMNALSDDLRCQINKLADLKADINKNCPECAL